MNTHTGQIRPLVIWPNHTLQTVCAPVDQLEDKHQLIADMKRTVSHHDGLGLAAPQVNDLSRIIIIRMPVEETTSSNQPLNIPNTDTIDANNSDMWGEQILTMINPELIKVDDRYTYSWMEGCLSVPGYFEQRKRPQRIVVQYTQENGHTIKQEFQGLDAFIVQHELDHLNGKVFVDELSRLKQQRVKKKIAKTQRRG